MANYCHLSYEDRKNIEDGLNDNKSINQIAKEITRCHSTILREIDRNKTFSKPTNWNYGNIYGNPNYNPHCPKLEKTPYVCNGCKSRSDCRKERYTYYARKADDTYKEIKSQARRGINLTPEEVGDMFNAIEEEPQDVVGYFKEMPLKYAGEVIYEMYTDNAVDILAYADPQDLNEYLHHVPQEAANEIREMLHYEDKTAGAIMSTEYVAITANQTVRSALQVVKKEALDAETIYYIYVIEDENKLQGVLTLRDLLTNDDDVLISDLMNTPVMSVRVDEDQAEVAQTIRDYNFLALPVTDFDDTLIGIINVDDIIDVIDEESAEDYSGFAGVDVENTPANFTPSPKIKVF